MLEVMFSSEVLASNHLEQGLLNLSGGVPLYVI
jgi:hypothetical protein